MKRGPKQKPLAERLSAMIEGNPDVTVPSEACWIWTGTPRQVIKIDGDAKMVVRVLFGFRWKEDLDKTNRPERKPSCPDRRCVNPDHFDLKPHQADRYGGQVLPLGLRNITPETDEEEIEGICWLIENRHYENPQAFIDYWLTKEPPSEYAIQNVEAAFHKMQRVF